MKKNETMNQEMVNELVKTFQTRMQNFGIKKGSKKYLDLQTEFMFGATRAIDLEVGNDTMTCVSPGVMFGVMRGEVLEVENKIVNSKN